MLDSQIHRTYYWVGAFSQKDVHVKMPTYNVLKKKIGLKFTIWETKFTAPFKSINLGVIWNCRTAMESLETSYMNTLAADNVTGVAMQWTYRDGGIVYQPTITSPFDIFVNVKNSNQPIFSSTRPNDDFKEWFIWTQPRPADFSYWTPFCTKAKCFYWAHLLNKTQMSHLILAYMHFWIIKIKVPENPVGKKWETESCLLWGHAHGANSWWINDQVRKNFISPILSCCRLQWVLLSFMYISPAQSDNIQELCVHSEFPDWTRT